MQNTNNESRTSDEELQPRPRSGRRGMAAYDDFDDGSVCWEITRVLLIVAAIVGIVLGGIYYLAQRLEGNVGPPQLRNPEEPF